MRNALLFFLLTVPFFAVAQVSTSAYINFEAGSTQLLLADNVNVRTAPQQGAAVVTKLPIATPVEILEAVDSLRMNGFSAPWYKVRFTGAGSQQEGYVWGGLIATGSDTSLTDPSVWFLYGLANVTPGEYFDSVTVQVRAVKGNKELARVDVPAVGKLSTYNQIETFPPRGVDGVKEVVDLDFTDGYCGGENGNVLLFWDGAALRYAATLGHWFDAPFASVERFVFPAEEGGKKGKLVWIYESNAEYAESEEDYNKMDVLERREYVWTGTILKQVK